MKAFYSISSLLLVTFAHANTLNLQARGQPSCINVTDAEASSFIDKFATTIDHTGDWQATAKEILSKDFVFASNSYLSRNKLPIGTGPTYGLAATSRKTYIQQLAELTVSSLTTDSLLVTNCGQVIWRANVGKAGSGDYPSKLIGILTLERAERKKGYGDGYVEDLADFVATRWECEFDSIGWSLGLGLDCGGCVS